MYSGGADSTLAAVHLLDKFDRVDLLTYKFFGIGDVRRSEVNFNILLERFGKDRVSHYYFNVGKLLGLVAYENYLANLKKWGFAVLLTCAFCKLAMHTRTIAYCLDNGIKTAADGANRYMRIYPGQMPEGVKLIKRLYETFDLQYLTPVYHYFDPYGVRQQSFLYKTKPAQRPKGAKSTGDVLYEMGLAPVRDLSRTKYARRIQDKCYGIVLLNIYVRWYFLQRRSYRDYEVMTGKLLEQKVAFCQRLIEGYVKDRENSLLGKVIGAERG